MNNGNTNSGGWASSRIRTEICSAFLKVMPTSWQNIITSCTKYTDNVGGGSSSYSSAVNTTQDKIWLLSEYKAMTKTISANGSESGKQVSYGIFGSTSYRGKWRHSDPSLNCALWSRSLSVSTKGSFCIINTQSSPSPMYASYSLGFAPCFQIS